jgi:hypothetical protein
LTGRRQQAFLVSTSNENVGSLRGVGGTDEDEGIVLALHLTVPGTKDGAEPLPLFNTLDGIWKDGNVECGPEAGGECRKLRMEKR